MLSSIPAFLNCLTFALLLTSKSSVLGQDSEEGEDVHFVLFTQTNRLDVIPRTIQYVNPNLPTIMVIHGWLAGINVEAFLLNITERYRAMNNSNVIFVDWSRDANRDYFTEAYSTISIIGDIVGQMIMTLFDNGAVDVTRVHLIGQSLGAHICGYAGRYVQEHHPQNAKIRRITALDAAGPLFGRSFGIVDNSLSLGASDADIVDVTHSNGQLFGISDAIGTIDFYLNGGLVQPYCGQFSDSNLFGQSILNICSHAFATIIFHETINSTAYRASTSPDRCENVIVYGDNFDGNATGIYYVRTENDYPYRSLC